MSKSKFLLPIIALLSLSACSGKDPISSKNPIIDDPIFKEHEINRPNKAFNSTHQDLQVNYIDSLKSFSADFYSAVASNENAIFSPISIATCYSMLFDGAKEETKQELKNMLHYDDSFDHLVEIQKMLLNNAINDAENGAYLDISQSLWIDDSFASNLSKDYFTKMQNYYFAEAYRGMLESDEMHGMLADYINAKTHDFLNVKKEDFAEYGGVLWLLNTIYMKAKWQNKFPVEDNINNPFNNIDGTTKNVDYMNLTISGSYYKADNYMITSLPYSNGLSMTILLPNEGTNYQKVLTDKTAIEAMIEYYNTRNHMPADMIYKIPKFKEQKSYGLTDILPNLGVTKCFDRDLANLLGLVDVPPKGNLFVSRSKHEAGIEVNNDGTEAAAYTIIEVECKAAMPPEGAVKFICDHPFAYIINTSEGLPLFMGVVNKF